MEGIKVKDLISNIGSGAAAAPAAPAAAAAPAADKGAAKKEEPKKKEEKKEESDEDGDMGFGNALFIFYVTFSYQILIMS